MKKYYEILGVAPGTNHDLLKKAYRKLAMTHHPDRQGGDAEKFKKISEAYEILIGTRKPPRAPQQPPPPPPPPRYQSSRYRHSNDNPFYYKPDFDFSEIFRDYEPSSWNTRKSRTPPEKPRPPRDESQIPVRIQLRISDILAGKVGTVPYTVSEDCSECNGAAPKEEVVCPECQGFGDITETIINQGMKMRYSTPCLRCNSKGSVFANKCSQCDGKGWKSVSKELKFEIKVKEEK